MRTNIDIDETLIQRAMEVSGQRTKRAVVAQALDEFVARRSQLDLRDLFGQITFAPGYDHKAAREGSS